MKFEDVKQMLYMADTGKSRMNYFTSMQQELLNAIVYAIKEVHYGIGLSVTTKCIIDFLDKLIMSESLESGKNAIEYICGRMDEVFDCFSEHCEEKSAAVQSYRNARILHTDNEFGACVLSLYVTLTKIMGDDLIRTAFDDMLFEIAEPK